MGRRGVPKGREGHEKRGLILGLALGAQEVIPIQYDSMEAFCGGVSVVTKDGKTGLVDVTGKELVPLGKYESIGPFSEGLGTVCRDGKWEYIDAASQEVISCALDYTEAGSFHEGRAAVANGGRRCGFIDRTGREIVPCQYIQVLDFSEGLVLVIDFPNRRGYIDKEGTAVIPIRYETSGDFSDGMAVVSSLDGEGQTVIDRTGREVVPFGRYSHIADFSEGLAAVIDQTGNYGYINAGGEEVIPCQYPYGGSFSGGYAVVGQYDADGERKYGYIDPAGREAAPCIYDQAEAVIQTVLPRSKIKSSPEPKAVPGCFSAIYSASTVKFSPSAVTLILEIGSM